MCVLSAPASYRYVRHLPRRKRQLCFHSTRGAPTGQTATDAPLSQPHAPARANISGEQVPARPTASLNRARDGATIRQTSRPASMASGRTINRVTGRNHIHTIASANPFIVIPPCVHCMCGVVPVRLLRKRYRKMNTRMRKICRTSAIISYLLGIICIFMHLRCQARLFPRPPSPDNVHRLDIVPVKVYTILTVSEIGLAPASAY